MNTSDILPNTLVNIVNYLKECKLNLSKNLRDGRINSAFNEDEIFNIIKSCFDINRPSMRDWVDFSFMQNDIFYPVNIKVSAMQTSDNLNCKLGIYCALSGKIPYFNNGISWEEYFKNLSENLALNDKDYYFLIINKNDTSDIFATSLKGLQNIMPNGNNLPFQAKWDNNRIPVLRNFKEAKDFILSTFAKSLKLRADAYFHFKRYFDYA